MLEQDVFVEPFRPVVLAQGLVDTRQVIPDRHANLVVVRLVGILFRVTIAVDSGTWDPTKKVLVSKP